MNKFIVAIAIIVCIGCNSTKSPYDIIAREVNITDGSKYITLIYYNPLECLNCNTILVSNFSKITEKDDVFLLYPSIRDIELKDYLNNLLAQGNIKFNTINDITIYNQGLQLANINPETNHKPMILLCSPYSKQIFAFDFKDPELIQKMNKLKEEKQ